jgi:2-dehydro-3-deoxyphosphogluconate aldolase/(4S)-4-hydroxy-2-oxoglutarate aldolase
MTKEEIRARIVEIGIIPAIRVYSESEALFAAEAVCSSGIPIVEVTMTIPGAVRIIGELLRHRTDIIVGAGTIFDVETAAQCLDAGAGFLTSPGLDLEIVEFAKTRDTLVLPGAMTPSEIMAAWKAGADFVKVFPCAQLGGPDYMRVLKAPFPRIPLIAAGGVNQKNAADYVLAGATALGIGQHLIHENAIKRRQRERIHELARRYINMVSDARRERTI